MIVVIATEVAADTNVSGYQWGTWDLAGSPYVLTGGVTVPKLEPLNDTNGNGVWDDAEPFTDLNENGYYDLGEPYTDLNENGQWDNAESYTDLDGSGSWTEDMPPLTIQSGVEVACSSYYPFSVEGTLQASQVSFTSLGGIGVQQDGIMHLTDCNSTGPGIWYSSGSSGMIDNCRLKVLGIYSTSVSITNGLEVHTLDIYAPISVSNISVVDKMRFFNAASVSNSTINYIEYHSNPASVTGCTLTYRTPIIMINPDIDLSGISGNTYTDANPAIQISGTLSASRSLGMVDGLYKYEFSSVTVPPGLTLNLLPGLEVAGISYGSPSLYVYGTVNADSISFNLGNYTGLEAESGGALNLTDCTVEATNSYIQYLSASTGTIDNCQVNNYFYL